MKPPSPLSKIILDGSEYLVKRDDLIHPFLSGNKYRKLYTLLQTPEQRYKKIISYGGTQSNAMLAIATICKDKKWIFEYYTKTMSAKLREDIDGNLMEAKNLGMLHIEIDNELYREYIASLELLIDSDTLLINQGGADNLAKEGFDVLALELKNISSVALPSGTGTSALYLALAMPQTKVYTVACIGNTHYLKEQMEALAKIPSNLIILEASKKYHFAKPYVEFYKMYKNLLDSEIEFDLLYAPLMWQTLLEHKIKDFVYIHSGGVSGNKSMLKRYMRKDFMKLL